MRNRLPVLLIVCFAAFGCENYKDEFEQISRERDSLIFVGDVKDSSINSFLAAFNEIEANLDSIVNREQAIELNSMQGTEIAGDQRERINEDIRIINDLLERNRALMADMQKQLRYSQGRVAELQTLADKLKQQVAEGEAQLVELKVQLAELNLNIDNLNVMLDTITAQKSVQEQQLAEKIERLHTAWYVVGTFKELRDKNVVNKEGGFLGIGKNQTLKQDFNNDAFTQIDVTKVASIPLDSRSVKIITNHPSNSYTLERKDSRITALDILDYDRFWGASKYLVVIRD